MQHCQAELQVSRKVSSIPCESVVCVEGECVGRLSEVKSK